LIALAVFRNLLPDIGRTAAVLCALILGLALPNPSEAQGLVCDADPLGRDCIECILTTLEDSRLGVCYQTAPALPPPREADAPCPRRRKQIETAIRGARLELQALMVANAGLAAKLTRFDDSGQSCDMLSEDLAEDLARPPATGNSAAQLIACLGDQMQEVDALFDRRENGVDNRGSELLRRRMLVLGDAIIELSEFSQIMERQITRAGQLQSRARNYLDLCSF